jgi:hypothetical protein
MHNKLHDNLKIPICIVEMSTFKNEPGMKLMDRRTQRSIERNSNYGSKSLLFFTSGFHQGG